MADDKSKEKSLEMRVADLEDKLKHVHISEDEMKAYQKVASLLAAGSSSAPALSPAGPTNCVQCVVQQCIAPQCIVQQCIVRCVVQQCIVTPCIIKQCINECGGGCLPGGGGVLGGGGFGSLGG